MNIKLLKFFQGLSALPPAICQEELAGAFDDSFFVLLTVSVVIQPHHFCILFLETAKSVWFKAASSVV